MTKSTFRSAALACLATGAGLATSTAFAQTRFPAPSAEDAGYAQPFTGDQGATVPPNVIGQYTCGYNEVHSRLERKNCGGFHYRY